jgi:L-alanine-DL-glutamate epimerase-like enolase superfamily enzyme
MTVAKMAQAHNLPVTSHGVHDLHVHLLAASPNGTYLEVHGFGLERFVAHPLHIVNGDAVAPDRPGHGVEFNWQALAEHSDAMI